MRLFSVNSKLYHFFSLNLINRHWNQYVTQNFSKIKNIKRKVFCSKDEAGVVILKNKKKKNNFKGPRKGNPDTLL